MPSQNGLGMHQQPQAPQLATPEADQEGGEEGPVRGSEFDPFRTELPLEPSELVA
ncbi:hypothetical protein AB0D09_31795 [Streptomyces sp. NPDC049097]|uniref:hypothetical protein n=1 Tax=unclassified Streptomyces TaxID=2593676 RepID=UPI0033ABF5C1